MFADKYTHSLYRCLLTVKRQRLKVKKQLDYGNVSIHYHMSNITSMPCQVRSANISFLVGLT